MRLFGDLKLGGWLTITVADDKLFLSSRGKTPKIPLIATTVLENVD